MEKYLSGEIFMSDDCSNFIDVNNINLNIC